MDTKKLLDIMDQLKTKISAHKGLSESKKSKFIAKIERISHVYPSIEIAEPFEDLAQSLEKRGGELLQSFKKVRDAKELADKIAHYLSYATASVYDFRGNILGINYYTRFFILTAALFMALTPQFYGFVLPLVFILPIFAGLRGIRRRSRTGLMMTLTVVPMAVMVSITWLRYFLQVALPNFTGTVSVMAQASNVSLGTAKILIIGPSILSILLLITSLGTAYFGYKYREMFV